jgi:hypothetical protein
MYERMNYQAISVFNIGFIDMGEQRGMWVTSQF